ncbi:MAG: IDEAL domain-containing protein [Bacilli bacterium]
MKNEKSPMDVTKSSHLYPRYSGKQDTWSLYIQMIIDEALLVRKRALLIQAIDEALDKKDEEAFASLSAAYRDISRYF